MISVVNAKNETTSYTYDLNGNMLTQKDGANHITTYEYNVANKPAKKIDHGGRTGTSPNYTYDSAKTERYTYDALGNLLTKLDRNGNTTTYTYDVHNRMLGQTVGTLSITYTYDGNGNQLTLTDSTGTTTRTYDALNRTKTKTVPGVTGSFTFLYDVTSSLPAAQVQVAETDTDPKGNVTTQVFNITGRMISVTAGGNTTTYTYYDNGSKHTVVYPGGNYEEYTYYADGLLNTLVNKKANQTVIDSYNYTYDAAHNLKTKTDSKGTTVYEYDSLNRLLNVSESGGKVTSYTFDAAGNRLTQTETQGTTTTLTTYTYNEQNRLTNILTKVNNVTAQTVVYTYDNNGNELTATEVPYNNGIPQASQVTTCTYDKFNQLRTTVMPAGTSLSNTYNGEGQRVAKQVNGVTTKYLYNGDKVVLELDGSNSQTARNVLGTSLISRTAGGTTLYYMYNGHADVTALVDADGTIQASYYYDAFGNVREQTGNFSNNILYAGYQYDKETGLYYCNSRMYDPAIARFLQEDTVTGDKNDPLSLNLYTYCHNEPLMYHDPTGHWNFTIRDGKVLAICDSDKDTLWELAQMRFSDGSRWKEFGFKVDEPGNLQIGDEVNFNVNVDLLLKSNNNPQPPTRSSKSTTDVKNEQQNKNPNNLSYYNVDFSKLSDPQKTTIQAILDELDRGPSVLDMLFNKNYEADWNQKQNDLLDSLMKTVELSNDPGFQKYLSVRNRIVEPIKGALQMIGGATEAMTGGGIAGGASWTGIGIPVGAGGAYMAVDGTSNVLGGWSKIVNGLTGSNSGDTWNFMKRGYKLISPDYGDQVYNLTQVGIGVFTIGKGLSELPSDSVKIFPRPKNIVLAQKEGLATNTIVLNAGNKVVITTQTESGMILSRTVINKAKVSGGSLLLIGIDEHNADNSANDLIP